MNLLAKILYIKSKRIQNIIKVKFRKKTCGNIVDYSHLYWKCFLSGEGGYTVFIVYRL